MRPYSEPLACELYEEKQNEQNDDIIDSTGMNKTKKI